jgi:hypothetical protein
MDSPSDLIVDVARAADPQRAAAMAQRLAALNASGDPQAFVDALSSATSSTPANFEPAVDARVALANPAQAEAGRATKARQQFEATLLNSFIGEMMPKDTSSAFGGGYAGDMWRSLLAEKVADQIAKSGALHLASRLFDNGNSPALEKLRGPKDDSATSHAASVSSSNDLSLPGARTVRGGAYLFGRNDTL